MVKDDIDSSWTKQKWWQGLVDGLVEHRFKEKAPLRLRAIQILNAAHMAVDISALVTSDEGPVHITSRSWTLLTRLRLGLPLDSLEHRSCPACGIMMDCFGDHVLCCNKLGINARHNEVRNEFASLCLELNLSIAIEDGLLGSSRRPADVLVHGLYGQPLAVDFAVVRQSRPTSGKPKDR